MPDFIVQSVHFDRKKFTRAQAIAWVSKHFHIKHFMKPVHETDKEFRIRLHDPADFKKKSFRTAEPEPGLKLIVAEKK